MSEIGAVLTIEQYSAILYIIRRQIWKPDAFVFTELGREYPFYIVGSLKNENEHIQNKHLFVYFKFFKVFSEWLFS